MQAPLVFFGNERLATGVTTEAPILRALVEAGYPVAAVVVNHEEATSRQARQLEIASVAHAFHIPILFPNKLSDIKEELRNLNAVAGVLVAYGKIVPKSIIDIFPKGIINIHPSLLPLHRGPTPIESVILSGEKETGVSLMALVPEMDAGPIYAQSKIPLNGRETKQALATTLLHEGAHLLIKNLPQILDGSLKPSPQEHDKATYDSLISKEDGVIDWSKPAQQIEREIRAYSNWPKSRTKLAGKDVVITSVDITPEEAPVGQPTVVNKSLIFGTSEQSIQILKLQPAGKNEMAAEAFLAGHGHLL